MRDQLSLQDHITGETGLDIQRVVPSGLAHPLTVSCPTNWWGFMAPLCSASHQRNAKQRYALRGRYPCVGTPNGNPVCVSGSPLSLLRARQSRAASGLPAIEHLHRTLASRAMPLRSMTAAAKAMPPTPPCFTRKQARPCVSSDSNPLANAWRAWRAHTDGACVCARGRAHWRMAVLW